MMLSVKRIKEDLEKLAHFTATPGKGVTRLAFTEEEIKARKYLEEQMQLASLEIHTDTAGNIFGRKAGRNNDLPVVMFGSHIDSVVHGGAFDGAAGVVTALEIMRVIHEENISTSLPLEMVVMTEEEGGRFGSGVWGSRAMIGNVSEDEIYRGKDKKGSSKAQAMESFGIDPTTVHEAARKKGSIRAFLELHVEQGPVLEQKVVDTGIVDSIVGIRTFFVTIWGNADHAGTTPMTYRKDALTGASRVIAGIDPIVRNAGKGAVGTVGMLNLEPGAFNIVPEKVEFSIDLRCSDGETIDSVAQKIKQDLEQVCGDLDLKYQWEEKLSVPPVIIDHEIIDIFIKAAEEKKISIHVMPSGAGHDAMVMASIAPVGMIFVPSRNGKSHCPEEWTDYDKLAKGVELMLGAVLRLAE